MNSGGVKRVGESPKSWKSGASIASSVSNSCLLTASMYWSASILGSWVIGSSRLHSRRDLEILQLDPDELEPSPRSSICCLRIDASAGRHAEAGTVAKALVIVRRGFAAEDFRRVVVAPEVASLIEVERLLARVRRKAGREDD